MYDHGHLIVMVVGREDDGLVFARIETRIDGALDAIEEIEVFAGDGGRITAALDVHQQRSLVGLLPVLCIIAIVRHILRYRYVRLDKRHIDVYTAIEIRGATLATRTPRTIEDPHKILATRRRTQCGTLDKIVTERRYRWIHIERYQE